MAADDTGRDPTTDQAATAQGKDRHVEREFEVGKDEAWSSQILEKDGLGFANRKRTYDEFQEESLQTMRQVRRQVEDLHSSAMESINRNRTIVDKMISDGQQFDNHRQTIANQSLQNAVETANMVSKQAVRHGDLSIDRIWNNDEVAALTAKSGAQQDAIVSAMVTALGKALQQIGGVPPQASGGGGGKKTGDGC